MPIHADLPSHGPSTRAEFEPHEVMALEGLLAGGQPVRRSSQLLSTLCLAALTEQVRQTGVWSSDPTDPEARFGDYRFLIVEFTDPAGIDRYVQIWSEPQCAVTMEVGPGDREDATLQAIANGMRAALTGRGFEIGGNAHNFRKFLVAVSDRNAQSIASEILAILTDVLGYDGTVDLTYRLHQDTRLRADHVLDGVSRSQVFDWFAAWGLNPRQAADDDTILEAHERDFEFRALLRIPKKTPPGACWEIHCYTWFPLPPDAATELLAEFNAKPGLFKVFAGSSADESTREIGMAVGINLAGGVTPAHIRAQICEWIDAAKNLRRFRARPPAASQSGDAAGAGAGAAAGSGSHTIN
jgi:hypothetical protein